MWELDCEESWVPKNWCFWTVVLEKTLESPLDCKDIQPVHLKGNQSWTFNGRTGVEAEMPILSPLDVKGWLLVQVAELLGSDLWSSMRGKSHCGLWGRRCWWKPSSCVRPSLSITSWGGWKGIGWKVLVELCKRTFVQTHFWWFCLDLLYKP